MRISDVKARSDTSIDIKIRAKEDELRRERTGVAEFKKT